MGSCRCKMCGGHIHYADDVSVATCEFCGTEQTIVRTDDLKQLNLFNRANSLRLQNEFDKAQTTYENILIDDQGGISIIDFGSVIFKEYVPLVIAPT